MKLGTNVGISIAVLALLITASIGLVLSRSTTRMTAAPGAPPTPIMARDRNAIIKMAQEQLPAWLNGLRVADEWKNFGYESGDELDRATLGAPFELWELTPEALATGQPGRLPALTDLRHYAFPILVDDQARGVLEVAYFQDMWQIVGGAQRSAGEPLVTLRSRLKGQPATIRLVRFFPANATFALIERDAGATMVLLGGYAGAFSQFDRAQLTEYPVDVAMAQIRAGYDEIQRFEQQQPHRAP